jgi:hypothetical protein
VLSREVQAKHLDLRVLHFDCSCRRTGDAGRVQEFADLRGTKRQLGTGKEVVLVDMLL